MSAKVKKIVKQLANELDDFELDGNWVLVRHLDQLDQILSFAPMRGGRKGNFQVYVGWVFRFDMDENLKTGSADYLLNIGQLIRVGNLILPCRDEKTCLKSYQRVLKTIQEWGFEYLEKRDSIEKIFEFYKNFDNEGMVIYDDDPHCYFSGSIDWEHYNLGLAYAYFGDNNNALKNFQIVLDDYTDENIDFEKDRAQQVKKYIRCLQLR